MGTEMWLAVQSGDTSETALQAMPGNLDLIAAAEWGPERARGNEQFSQTSAGQHSSSGVRWPFLPHLGADA